MRSHELFADAVRNIVAHPFRTNYECPVIDYKLLPVGPGGDPGEQSHAQATINWSVYTLGCDTPVAPRAPPTWFSSLMLGAAT